MSKTVDNDAPKIGSKNSSGGKSIIPSEPGNTSTDGDANTTTVAPATPNRVPPKPPTLQLKRNGKATRPEALWLHLPAHLLPPLFQGLAPLLPTDEGIEDLRHEREQWRQAWLTYARNLQRVVETMLENERDSDGAVQAYIDALEALVQSIRDDIDEVLLEHRDIRSAWVPVRLGVRTSDSYLAHSSDALQGLRAPIGMRLSGRGDPAWGDNPLSNRTFDETYPGDRFREILHYRPAHARPIGRHLRPKLPTTWALPLSPFFQGLLLVAIICIILCSLLFMAGVAYQVLFRPLGSMLNGPSTASTTANSFANAVSRFLKGSKPVVFQVKGTMRPTAASGIADSTLGALNDAVPPIFRINGAMKIF